ncbi:STE24 endopeptidase, partial [Tremellales sp. Uapishka_1]
MTNGVISFMDNVITTLAAHFDQSWIDYKAIIIAGTWVQTGVEVYLLQRQLPCYDKPKPPPELAAHMPQETFEKAQKYGKDKARFQLAKIVFNQLLNYGLLKFDFYARSWTWTESLMLKISHSLLWMTVVGVVSMIPAIPWDYYYTFVLEEKHGFNKSTRKLWVMDQLKTLPLVAGLGLPFLAAFLKIIEVTGKLFVPWLMVFIYFYGLPWSKQIVIYDTLIDKSTPPEVEAVLGHELGHWYFGKWNTFCRRARTDLLAAHPSKLLLIGQAHLLFTLTMFSVFAKNRSLYSSFGFDPALALASPYGGPQPIIIGFNLFTMLFEPLDMLVKMMMNAQTRKYEYQAERLRAMDGFAPSKPLKLKDTKGKKEL